MANTTSNWLQSFKTQPARDEARASSRRPPGLEIPVCEFRNIAIHFRSRGRLLPWIGPALRGLTNRAWKLNLCLQPDEELRLHWSHCHHSSVLDAPCPMIDDCVYGRTFEYFNHPKLVVISPEFPMPLQSDVGKTVRFKLLCIGATSIQFAWKWLELLQDLGNRGLGSHRVKFQTDLSQCRRQPVYLPVDALPNRIEQRDVYRRVNLTLQSPLFLRSRTPSDHRAPNMSPSFLDIYRASDGQLRALSRRLGIELPDNAELLERAKSVESEAIDYRPFEQHRRSTRGDFGFGARFEMRGVTGTVTFRDVPADFAPWLTWAGLLHTGMHRSAGAGNWDLKFD